LLQGLLLEQMMGYYFRSNRYWLRARNIYSHSLVFFSQNHWVVQCFVFERPRTVSKRQFFFLKKQLRQLIIVYRLMTKGFLLRRNWELYPTRRRVKYLKRFSLTRGYGLENDKKLFQPWINSSWDQTYHQLIFFHPSSYDQMFDQGLTRYDSTKFLQPFEHKLTTPNLKFLFSQLLNQLRPTQSRLSFLERLSQKLTTQYKIIIKNKIYLYWRVLSYIRHGLIKLWLNFLKFRINNRGTYRVRSIVYPLYRYVKQHRLANQGWELRCQGRFSRQQRAEHKLFRFGSGVKATTYYHVVDQVFFTFPLKFGSIGLKLTVRY